MCCSGFSSWPFPVLWSSCNSVNPSLKSEMWGQNDKQEDEVRDFVGERVGGLGRGGVHRDSSRSKDALRMTAGTGNDVEQATVMFVTLSGEQCG